MDRLEAYSLLFTDTIFGNILLYAHSEFILHIIKNLGGYDKLISFVVASIGFAIAVAFNYLCGLILYRIYQSTTDSEKQRNYLKLHAFFHQYGHYILLTNVMPLFGIFMPLLAGFVNFGFKKSVIISLLSKMLFYIYYIYF
ncbi:MAG UNVERIFIED_CONTAM: hypothetical protein LVQ98_01830 [Rickettsiaceae bacterium]|jgi:membrane protein YqaA with SNARE-associated domain